MRLGFCTVLLAAGAVLALAMPAFAQPANILAPLNEQPAEVSYTGHNFFLAAAHGAVVQFRWTTAENELEQAETYLLNGGVTSASGVVTSLSPALPYIIAARAAVEQRDQVNALLAIDRAMGVVGASPQSAPPLIVAHNAPPASSGVSVGALQAAQVPPVTKALLPGHWQLTGWKYHWVLPDTQYRDVQINPFIPGHYEYFSGEWHWVGGHYGSPAS
jgi:hypothetical protein